MADQRVIKLWPGNATPSTIVLRDLPVASLQAQPTIYLYSFDATPSTIILRDPTAVPESGGATDYPLSGANGTYTYTGQDAALTLARYLTGDAGAYVFAGQDATLTYTPGATAVDYELAGDFGAYTFLGQDADLSVLPGYSPAPIDIQVSVIGRDNSLYLHKKRKKRRAFLLLG